MKKFAAVFMALTMVLTLFVGCGTADTGETTESTEAGSENVEATTEATSQAATEESTEEITDAAPVVDKSLEEIIDEIYTNNPVEFATMTMALNLEDTSEDGLWALNYNTGLENADMITEAVVSEAAIGSTPFSMVLVRVQPGLAAPVADAMRAGINQRKWICVEADDLMIVTCEDVVMLVMIGSNLGKADSFVTAFAAVVGEPEYVIK